MKNIMLFIITMLLFVCSGDVFSKSHDFDVKKITKGYKKMMSKNMLIVYEQMCQESEDYVRKCFKVTEIECKQLVRTGVKSCLAKYDEQIKITDDKAGAKWGRLLGRCLGNIYEEKFMSEDRMIFSQECAELKKSPNPEKITQDIKTVFDNLN
jgi:hypothetical protein